MTGSWNDDPFKKNGRPESVKADDLEGKAVKALSDYEAASDKTALSLSDALELAKHEAAEEWLIGRLFQIASSKTSMAKSAVESLLNRRQGDRGRQASAIEWLMADFGRFIDYTNADYVMTSFHRYLIDRISHHALKDGGRLYIGMPPRHGKSELCSVMLPAWYLGLNPNKQVIHISHSAGLSKSFSRRVRLFISSNERYKELFPDVVLDPERKPIEDWKIFGGDGGFMTKGMGAAISGHGADLLIIDDPHKDDDWMSPNRLEFVWDHYTRAVSTRLMPGASIIFLMTRWHPLDLAGRLLQESSSDWEEITIPALAGADDVFGRAPGAALWPERYSAERLREIRLEIGERSFGALYQNNPRATGDVMFRRDDIVFSDDEPALIGGMARFHPFWTFDLASTAKERSDYTVMARWQYDGSKLWLLDSQRGRWTFPVVQDRIAALYEEYPKDAFVFPNDVLELLAYQQLAHRMGSLRLYTIPMAGDKVQKATPLAALVESGRFVVCSDKGDNAAFVRELCDFPLGVHDDSVDAASLAVHYLGVGNEAMSFLRRERDDDTSSD